MPLFHPIVFDALVLALAAVLLLNGSRQLHYRDVPYLFLRRRLLWGASSFLLQGLVLVGVMATLLEDYSAVWWLGVMLGSLPALLILGYALQVLSNPRRVAMLNKRNWKGPERVP